MHVPPPNAYSPGTKLTVGSHNISVIKYISEGGFAHVYTCNIDPPFKGSAIGCLKRVVVPNKWELTLLRQEVDAMRRLRGNAHIVSYIDSHASRLNNPLKASLGVPEQQQYEVFLLMEYCENDGLIDFMNTRLVHKLTEPEILKIMYEVTIGVAMCHHLQPPLIHRDIKIENVLMDSKGTYKLCDFGSAVGYSPAPKTPHELKRLRDDLMQHTTPQYRSPEMIDLTRGFPIDDKSDIWALGCFLFKLCYYTTPFESPDQKSLQDMEQSILNCSNTLRFNNKPGSIFSPRLKNIIKCCLREDPRRRPNAVQLLGEICAMKGETKIPNVVPYSVKEHYNTHLKSTKSNNEHSPPLLHRPTDTRNDNRTNNNVKNADPFASIDKSKLLQATLQSNNKSQEKGTNPRPKSTYVSPSTTNTSPSRPLSAYIDESRLQRSRSPHNASTSSLKDYIQKQLNESSEDISSARRLEEQEKGTLEFLRTKEESYKSSLNSKQNTGGSFKATLKNSLRKISTGSSIHSVSSNHNTGNNKATLKASKRSSISSIKQIINGNSFRKSSSSPEESIDYNHLSSPEDEKPARKLSIQRRMQILFNSAREPSSIQKSAHAYGRFTDSKAVDDITAINNGNLSSSSSEELTAPSMKLFKTYGSSHKLAPPKVPASLAAHKSIQSIEKSTVASERHVQPTRLKKSDSKPISKKPPAKPKKPTYLRSPEKKKQHERKLSNSSEISIPDLDDLEKQFSKRFPSYV